MRFFRASGPVAWLVCAAISGCAPPPVPEPGVITASDNGSTVRVSEKGMLLVRLPSSGTTGYTWAPAQIPEQLTLKSDDYKPPREPQQQPPVAGAGGTQELGFTPTKAGTGTLVLTYRPAWDASADPAQTYRVTTEVVGQ